MSDETPKIHIDDDWKTQAKAEKEKLTEKAKEQPAGGAGDIPEPSFDNLVRTMATQALLFMGAIPDPRTGQRIQHLDLSRHHIDTLAVIEEKTKGNLSEEEQEMLTTTLYELRQAYIQLSTAARSGGQG